MRNPLSDTIVKIKPSGIRKFFDIVSEMEDAISLGVGEPDFDTPWHIRDEGIYSLEKGRTFYTSNAGLNDLKVEICNYLKRNGYNNVAIYGGRDSGWHVVKQLQKTEIIVKYVIDKIVFSGEIGSLSIFRPDDELPEVDAVIVTPVWDYCNIKEQISRQINCPIISLEDVIAGAIDE